MSIARKADGVEILVRSFGVSHAGLRPDEHFTPARRISQMTGDTLIVCAVFYPVSIEATAAAE